MTIYTTGASNLPAIAERNRNSMMLQAGITDVNPLQVWDGVHSGMYLAKTSGMGFVIGAGRAAINMPSMADGTMTVVLTGDEPGAFTENPTGADRYDLIILRAYPDNPSETGVKVEVVAGVPGVTGWPAVPPGSIPLYGVIITAGMSAANGGWNRAWATDRRRVIGVPEFINYTPTFVGWDNLGSNPKIWGKYRLDGNKCTVEVSYEGGVGASMGDYHALAFTLPIPAKGGFVYNGKGSLHHPNVTGLAYQLHILSNDSMAAIWKPNPDGALVQPGRALPLPYPWQQGTVLFAQLEYDVDEAYALMGIGNGDGS